MVRFAKRYLAVALQFLVVACVGLMSASTAQAEPATYLKKKEPIYWYSVSNSGYPIETLYGGIAVSPQAVAQSWQTYSNDYYKKTGQPLTVQAINVKPDLDYVSYNGYPFQWYWDALYIFEDGTTSTVVKSGVAYLTAFCPATENAEWPFIGGYPPSIDPVLSTASNYVMYCPEVEAIPVEQPQMCPAPGGRSHNRLDGISTPNPIMLSTGEKYLNELDFKDDGAHAITFLRNYSSTGRFTVGMGQAWLHNHAINLRVIQGQAYVPKPPPTNPIAPRYSTGGNRVVITLSNGGQYSFSKQANQWIPDWGTDTLTQTPTGFTYKATEQDRTYSFKTNGQLQAITERNGWVMAYSYNSAGQLTQVRNQFGRTLGLAYSGNLLTRLATPDGKTTAYTYDANSRLTQVTYPDGSNRSYLYGKTAFPQAITGISDNGTRLTTYTYDAQGRATSSAFAGSVQRYQVNYQGTDIASPVTVTDPLGTQRSYSYSTLNGKAVVISANQPSGIGLADAAYRTQNNEGLIDSERSFTGTQTTTTWNPTRRLPLTVTEAAGNPEARTTSTEWHPQWRLPVKVTSPGRVTSYTYDSAGNALSQTLLDTTNNQSRTTRWTYNTQGLVASETAPNGAVTSYTYDAAGNLVQSANALGHTSTYTYDGAGRVTSTTSPTGLVTAYTYDARGRVLTINRGGQVTTNTYNANGQLATAKLANGHQITYTYDAAQRLTGWSDNRGASATYQLDAMGNRVREEIRDAKGQHWLLARSINAINRVESTTAGGYLTTHYTYDQNGDLVSATNGKNESTSATLDALRRTKAITNANSATASLTRNAQDDVTTATDYKGVTTQYNRDTLGNATLEASKDSGNETAAFDALGLPSRTIDALGKATNITRDILGRPTKITHPASSTSAVTTAATTTTITYDQTGDTYNAPGQPNASKGSATTIVDASGTTTYQRDAFGRITSATQKLKGLGDGAMQTTATSYTPAGQVNTITYPSGGKLAHTYNATGQLTALSWNGNPLLANITTNPLGQPTSWTWQYADTNSATKLDTFRTYNSAGQLTQTNTAAYTYDAAGRITAINQNLLAPASTKASDTTLTTLTIPWSVQYDSLGRITQFKTAGKTATVAATATTAAINATYYQSSTDYQFDANGNRTAKVTTAITDQGAWSHNQQYTTTSSTNGTNGTTNRLLGIATTSKLGTQAPVSTATTIQYNSAGDPSTDGQRNTTYNGQRRIDSMVKTGTTATPSPAKTYYATNALGQRVFKTEPLFGTPTADAKKLGWAYAYDEEGTLLGEYGMGGAASSGSTEHIYLPTAAGPLPVAAIINGQHYAVHADHLNTPRRLTAANNQVVWQWAYSAFGETEPTTANKRFTSTATKPSNSTGNTGIQPTTYNLRYPGQAG